MSTKFLIVSNIRCGATYLQSLLSKFPMISCMDEFRWKSDCVKSPYRVFLDSEKFSIGEYFEERCFKGNIMGSKLLLDPCLKGKLEWEDLRKTINADIRIIHIQRSYGDVIRSVLQNRRYSIDENCLDENTSNVVSFLHKEGVRESSYTKVSFSRCVEMIKSLYENDLFFRSLGTDREFYLQVDYEDLFEHLMKIICFIGSSISYPDFCRLRRKSELRKLPEGDMPKILRYSKVASVLKTYEGLRILLKNTPHLSKAVCASIFSNDKKEVFPKFEGEVKEEHNPVTIFIDIAPSQKFLDAFLRKIPGKGSNTIIIIISRFSVIWEILTSHIYHQLIAKKIIKIWHAIDWEERMKEEMEDIRSPVFFCKSIVFCDGHPLGVKLKEAIEVGRRKYFDRVEDAKRSIGDYYKSKEFQGRLKKIAEGKKPRIYLDRACSSIAVKRFSDNCAKHFKELGCEVYMHAPCRGGQMDWLHASYLEIDRFKPDLHVRTPNMVKGYKSSTFSIEIPTIYSLQDLGPHSDCARLLKKNPLGHNDLLFFILRDFEERFIHSGVSKTQLICSYLPAEEVEFEVKKDIAVPEYDVGYVKTMGNYLSLRELFTVKTEEEKRSIDAIEEEIQKRIKTSGAWDLADCASLGRNREEQQKAISFYHEQLSLFYMEILRDAGFRLGLTGANWDRIPGLKKYSLGHAESRLDYQMRFFCNKINISLNPWALYHPRIFEGGMCGGFFLVYRVPDIWSCCDMPKEMEAGKHFDYFSSPEDLVNKCKYYLERDELRKEIGMNLRELLKEGFSYKRLCRSLLKKIKKSLRVQC